MSQTDRQFYADWLQRLQDSELAPAEFPALVKAKRAIAELEGQRALLCARRDEIESEISATEVALSERTRQLLGVKE